MTIKDMKKSLVVFLAIFGLFSGAKASAVTYTSEATVQFRIKSEITINIDEADIQILDLAPGTSSDSNVVGITISTNNLVGYTASATVGSAANASTNMTHSNGTNVFSSIDTEDSLPTLTTDNTWGYSTSTDDGTSWANFSGLPIYTDTAKQIAATDSPSNDAIKFKINAKASTSQPAGDYTNVINFTVVANIPPRTIGEVLEDDPDVPRDPETGLPTIQSVTEEVCDMAGILDEASVITDVRDHQNYRVAKLRDNRCWLLDNMQLDLMTTSLASLQGNTNAPNEALSYLKGVSSRDPSSEPEGNYPIKPVQYGVPNHYEGSNDYSFSVPKIWVENKDEVKSNDPIEAVRTSKYGILYNFCAASAGTYCYGTATKSGPGYDYPATNQDKPNTAIDAVGDICPTNWRLPTGLNYDAVNMPDGGEWLNLYNAYSNNGTTVRTITLLSQAGYYDFDGGYNNNKGSQGNYWSSTFSGPRHIAMTYVFDDYLYFGYEGYRVFAGYPVRCLVNRAPQLTIAFDANDGYGSMESQKVKYGRTTRLQNNTYTRTGYTFSGWNTEADGTGTSYSNRADFTAPSTTTTTKITLYAQWTLDSSVNWKTLQDAYEMAYVENSDGSGHYYDSNEGRYKKGLYVPHKTDGVYDGTYFEATQESDYAGIPSEDLRFAIQDINLTINGVKVCDYATLPGSEANVLDLRDYTSYRIMKAPDGRCWMKDNLNLDLTAANASTRITSANTNASSTALDALFGRANRNAASDPNGNLATAGVIASTSSNSFSVPEIDVSYKDTPIYGSLVVGDPIADAVTNGQWRAGVYYNYCAASAGSYCYGNGYSGSDVYDRPNTAVDSEYDVCPAGWRLPTSDGNDADSNEIKALYDIYGDYTGFRKALHLPLPNYSMYGYVDYIGYGGYYWASTYNPNDHDDMMSLYMNAPTTDPPVVNPSSMTRRYWTISIRCIAK